MKGQVRPPPAASSAEASAPNAISAQYILISWAPILSTVSRSKRDAGERARMVLERARSEGDFAALARDYSDDGATKDRGGDIGAFSRGDHVKPFSDAAFALEVGQISDVIETRFGYCIIKRTR